MTSEGARAVQTIPVQLNVQMEALHEEGRGGEGMEVSRREVAVVVHFSEM